MLVAALATAGSRYPSPMEWDEQEHVYRLASGKVLTRMLQEVDPAFVLFEVGQASELRLADHANAFGDLTDKERLELAEFMAMRWLRWAARAGRNAADGTTPAAG
jgi:hypothetical protein